MPTTDPRLQEALREAGLTNDKKTSLSEKLAAENLTTEDAIQLLADIAYSSTSETSLKLRAVETVLKLQGLMKDTAPAAPVVNFIIQDSEGPRGINPILIPRPQAAPELIDAI